MSCRWAWPAAWADMCLALAVHGCNPDHGPLTAKPETGPLRRPVGCGRAAAGKRHPSPAHTSPAHLLCESAEPVTRNQDVSGQGEGGGAKECVCVCVCEHMSCRPRVFTMMWPRSLQISNICTCINMSNHKRATGDTHHTPQRHRQPSTP